MSHPSEAEKHMKAIRSIVSAEIRATWPRITCRQWNGDQTCPNDCKIVHFVRHGEAIHNAAMSSAPPGRKCHCETDGASPEQLKDCIYKDISLKDPHLTDLGREQARLLNAKAKILNADLIVVSPMARAIETALIGFEPLISSSSISIPIIAVENAREQFGGHVCDSRRPISEIKAEFPTVDFSYCPEDDQHDSPNEPRETKLHLAERALSVIEWVMHREEKHIIVVTHSAFLLSLFNSVFDIAPNDEGLARWFDKAEMRSTVISYK